MAHFLSKYKYWIFVWTLFIFLRLPSFFEPYWYGDEGIYLTLGQGIRKGLILYKQIHDNKPPSLYYLAAIAKTVFGFRFMLSLFMVPTIYLFYHLSQKFLSKNLSKVSLFIFVILTSLPILEGNIANAEIFMLLPTIAGLLLFFNSKKNFYFYLSGLLLGLAFTIKIPVFIEAGFLIFYLLFSHFSEIKKHFLIYISRPFFLGFGFLTPIIFYFIYFYFLHAWPEFLHSAILQNFSYISSWATSSQTASVTSGGVLQRLIFLLVSWLILTILSYKKIITTHLALILGWFFSCIFGALLSTRPYPHYLIQIIPPFCLLLTYFLNHKKYITKTLILISFFFLGFLIKKYNFYFYPSFSYYRNFYSHLTQLQTSNDYKRYFNDNVGTTYQVSDYINRFSSFDDKIFVWGDEPYIYALSDRLPPGKYTVAYHISDFNGYQETIDSLKSNLPKFVVYFPMENRSFNQLDDILNRYYFLDKKIGTSLIFQKR